MLKTLVKVAEVVSAALALAFLVLLFFNPNDEDQTQPATFEGNEEIAADPKAKGEDGNGNGENGDGDETTTTAEEGDGGGADGAALYADNCAGCHRDDGSGGSGGPDIQGASEGRVVDIVTNGGFTMPGFGDDLSEEEIDAIATYVAEEL